MMKVILVSNSASAHRIILLLKHTVTTFYGHTKSLIIVGAS